MEEKKDSFFDYLKEIPNYLTIFIVPIYFMTASPMLLEMGRSTGIYPANLSLIFTFFTIGLILGQLTSVLYNRKLRKFLVITYGYICIIPLLFLLSITKNLYLFYILYFLIGYISGVIWIQATKYVLENKIKNKDRLTTIFLSFYPMGNFVAPLIASMLVDNGLSWSYSYYIMILITIIILILYFILKKGKKGQLLKEEEEKVGFKEIFTNRKINILFIIGCFLLLFYCISETVVAAWAPTFLRMEKLFEVNTAGWAVSLFWIAVLIGRVIVSALAGKFRPDYMMLALSFIAIIAMTIFLYLDNTMGLLIAVFFAGLGCSGIITLGVSSTSTLYTKGSGLLASIVFAAINIGVSAGPFLTSWVSKYNLTASMALAPIFMGVTAAVIIIKIVYTQIIIEYPGA